MRTQSFAMDHQQIRRTLLNIQSVAEHLTGITKPRLPKETTKVVSSTCPMVSIPALDLPFPNNLDATLKSLGLSDRGYYETSCKIQEWVHSLQKTHSLHFERSCHSLASLTHLKNQPLDSAIEQLRIAYQKKYDNYLPLVMKQILSPRSRQNSIGKTVKTPFNNEYLPLLELYFEENAYPSLPDRQLLARESMMTMRQIEVWFQNHRARARKEGKVVKKLSGSCQSRFNLETLKDRVSFTAINSAIKLSADNEAKDDEFSEGETPTSTPPVILSSFSEVAPPYAFPNVYTPNSTIDPYPNKFTFPPPIWMRKPTQPKAHPTVDMEELISIFASKLHLRDGSRKKCDIQCLHTTKNQRTPWFAPMLVIPPPAPLPALIRTPYMYASNARNPSCNQTYAASSSSSFTSPVSPSTTYRRPQKFAPFSKRIPSALPANHTSGRPIPFSAFASRTSSLSSVASSQSRTSSMSTLSSPEPTTPAMSPTHPVQNPLFSDHNYQLLDELFGLEPSQLFNNLSYTHPDLFLSGMLPKEIPPNPLYDLSTMFPPAVAQVHC